MVLLGIVSAGSVVTDRYYSFLIPLQFCEVKGKNNIQMLEISRVPSVGICLYHFWEMWLHFHHYYFCIIYVSINLFICVSIFYPYLRAYSMNYYLLELRSTSLPVCNYPKINHSSKELHGEVCSYSPRFQASGGRPRLVWTNITRNIAQANIFQHIPT